MSGDNTSLQTKEPGDRLKAAQDRLATAIGRLEAGLERRQASLNAKSAQQGSANASLAAELSRLQTENVQLRHLVGHAAGRLDDAIDALKAHIPG